MWALMTLASLEQFQIHFTQGTELFSIVFRKEARMTRKISSTGVS